MNFKGAKHTRDIIWYDGPLMSEFEHNGKFYFLKWVDVNDDHTTHTWMIFDVTPENVGLYFGKAITLRDLEERAENHFFYEDSLDDEDYSGESDEAVWFDFENAPDGWKARSNSYYDEILAPW